MFFFTTGDKPRLLTEELKHVQNMEVMFKGLEWESKNHSPNSSDQ